MWNLMGRTFAAAASSAALMALAACDGGASAVAARDQTTTNLTTGSQSSVPATFASAERAPAAERGPEIDPRTQPIPVVDGKPMWAPNRRLDAEAAAKANFERNGADFGARSVEAWVTQVHDFVDSAPRGVQRMTRANGDRLFYDAKANVFAVATRDGAPRTMFKPREGAAYWDQQKAAEASRVARAAARPADEG